MTVAPERLRSTGLDDSSSRHLASNQLLDAKMPVWLKVRRNF